MAAAGNGLVHPKTEFDNWRSLTIGIYMALVGYAVMVGLPVISTAWVEHQGFTEVQVGRVAGADLFGLFLGAVISYFFVATTDRRWLAAGSAALAITANLLCIWFQTYEITLVLRVLAGTGAGVYTGIAVATIGGHSRPAFAFGIELAAFAASQGAELAFLPYLSIEGIYITLVLTYVVGLLFISWLPRRPATRPTTVEAEVVDADSGRVHERMNIPRYVPWLVLTAIVFTYINIGAYWAYVELATVGTAADPDFVASILWQTSVFSVIGCLFAVLLSNRYGLAKPLMVTLVVQAIIVVMLVYGITNVRIAISMYIFMFCWIFVDVYQAANLANVDRIGKHLALIPAAQGLGNALGPIAGSIVLAWGLGYNGVFILCGIASITAMLIYLYMYLRLRKSIPELADAS